MNTIQDIIQDQEYKWGEKREKEAKEIEVDTTLIDEGRRWADEHGEL